MKRLFNSLTIKLLLSHLLVTGIGILTLAISIQLFVPNAYSRHMNMMGQAGEMMNTHTPRNQGTSGNQGTLENFKAGVNEALLYGVATASMAAILFSIFYSRRIVTPVQQMMKSSQNISEGNYTERVHTREKDETKADELDRLALSFNKMTEKLEKIESRRIQLIGDMAHELRTPLTIIKGNMEGMMDGLIKTDTDTLELVNTEIKSMEKLVNDLQELSRVEAGTYHFDLKPVRVFDLLTTLDKRMQRNLIEKGISLDIQFPDQTMSVWADEDRTGQILVNLISNALQYTPAGGHVKIFTALRGDFCLFTITDTGVGIAEENLPYIFDRFFRVDKSRSRIHGGSGIGSTIARHFVQAQGGEIKIESPGIGKGTTVTFTLPIASK